MARPELGTKHRCRSCATRYYDLNRANIVCPRCGEPLETPARTARETDGGEEKTRETDAPAAVLDGQTAAAGISTAKRDPGDGKLDDIEDTGLDDTLEEEDDDTLFLDDEDDDNTDIPMNVKIDDEDRES